MKTRVILCLMMLFNVVLISAQNLTVTGIVTEGSSGEPAIGVNVLVKGTTNGTITSIDGDYTLSDVPKNAVLVFSYVGMKTKEVEVKGKTQVNVVLEEDSESLEEVVVIGYGTSKSKDLTAPIAVIKSDEITKHATSSPMGALQGKIAGVQITNNGQPGSGPSVRIRGIGSMNDDSQPLYVVDGMFFDNINFLNNSDIQDISILKDASAASIYGVRAANGVVLVTTKKGALNRPATVTYDGYVGFQKATNVLEMANSEQYATMVREMKNETLEAVLKKAEDTWGGLPDTDWYDEILRTALTYNHSIDVSGGTEKATYSVGASYLYQDGILDAENSYKRFNMRAQADYRVFNWLKIGTNTVFSNATQTIPNSKVWLSAFRTPSIIPVYDENSPLNPYPEKFASPAQIGLSEFYDNPVANTQYYDSQSKQLRIMPSFYAQLDLLPDNKLVFKTQYSQDINIVQLRNYTPEFLVGGTQLQSTPSLKKQHDIYSSYIVDNILTYRDQFNDHSLTVMAGNSVREENWRNLWGEATGVPGGFDEYLYLNQGNADGRKTGDDGTTYRGVSWFGRISYDYKGKYLFSATMRADGSSKYQEKWGYFPSVGAAWNISEEDFMKNVSWVNYLKLRGSWGKLGNDKIQASDGFASITQNMDTSGIFAGAAVPGFTNLVYFSWLGWETVNETNLGLDFHTLNSRLKIEADWYYRLTQNAVINSPLPMGAGNLLGNNGEILNTGVELSVNWSDKIGKDFNYYIGANISTLHNEVKSLNGSPYLYGGSAEFRTISKVGGELNAYYGYEVAGVYQNEAEIAADPVAVANGLEPGDFKYVDQNGDGKIDNNDRTTLGSYVPNFTYGLNLGFSYKNFDFSMSMQGVTGNQIVNRKRGDRRWHSDLNYDADQVENRWTGEGSTNSYPSAAGSVKAWNIANFNSFFVEDGSYFRIQNIQLAYTFPQKQFNKVKMPSIRLSLTADRPFTFFKANSFTPELSGTKNADGTMPTSSYGFDEQVYPLAASYTLGLRITY